MWIELSEFNIKIFIPIIYPIFQRIGDYSKKLYMVKDNNIFKTFKYFLSHIFSAIFLLIAYRRSKKISSISMRLTKENEIRKDILLNNHMINEIEELKKKNEKRTKIKSILFLILLCITSMFSYLYRLIRKKDEYTDAKQSIGIFLYICFFILLSYIILKQKLYKHSYISAGTIALVLLVLFILTINIKGSIILGSFPYYIVYSLSFSCYDVLGKKYMNKFYKTPYYLMFMVGLINSIALIIFDIFAYYFNRDISGVIIGFQKNISSVSDAFGFIVDLLVKFCWLLGIWLTISYYSPCHYFICSYISDFMYYIINAFDSDDEEFYSTVNIIIFSMAYIINFFCSLVFNEVIILNFCGLDYNTKKRIQQRMKTDNLTLYEENDTASTKQLNTESERETNSSINDY